MNKHLRWVYILLSDSVTERYKEGSCKGRLDIDRLGERRWIMLRYEELLMTGRESVCRANEGAGDKEGAEPRGQRY